MVVIEMKRLLYTGDLFIDLVLLRTHPSNQGKFSLVKINLPICFKFIKKFAYFWGMTNASLGIRIII